MAREFMLAYWTEVKTSWPNVSPTLSLTLLTVFLLQTLTNTKIESPALVANAAEL
ncbi:MAG: hypothetical protein ACREDE_01615 [Thermoplasmata archaeon]